MHKYKCIDINMQRNDDIKHEVKRNQIYIDYIENG